jgi:two-component system, LytTR family, sensor kinase
MYRANPILPDPPDAPSGPFTRDVVKLGLGFAVALFLVSSFVWSLVGFDPVASALGKLIGLGVDSLLAITITVILWLLRDFALGLKAIAACLLSLALAPLSALADRGLQLYYMAPVVPPIDPTYIAQVVIFTTSELFGWSCLYLALQYSRQIRAAERRIAAAQQQAIGAQMRALHYQVNPHFLYNTLNSLAGLIEEDQRAVACDMILKLGDYLRQTLTLDPEHDIPLGDEIALQMLYIGIEQIRFSDRLNVRLDVDPATRDLLVPPLILQPLIENAMKHGISRVTGRADLVIGARQSPDGQLHLRVENTAPSPDLAAPDPAAPEGLGIGLANVRDRLAMLWPGLAALETGPAEGGRHCTELVFPGRR